MEFIDREDELALLEAHAQRPGAAMFVLYGRRRIGKTALLERWLSGRRRAAYHVGTRSTMLEELRRLSAVLADAWDLPLLAAQPLASTEALLALLGSTDEPSVLVLDEFPFLAESDPALPGLLQAAWDSRISRTPVKLVLCGSSVSVMEETFLSARAPLFGRRTGQLSLGPLPLAAAAAPFQLSSPEKIELLALFGGVPGYLRRLDTAASPRENLRRFVLARGEPLYEEVPFLLREELREPRVYQSILATIASGSRKFGEIASKVGLDRANLTRYLATLATLGLVERAVPVTEHDPARSRKGLYRIADPFVGTWFALVHPFRDALERGRFDLVERAFDDALARLLPFAVEAALTALCRQWIPFEPAAVGRFWSPTCELDIVALSQDRRRAWVAEVKWSAKPVPHDLAADLRRRVAAAHELEGVDVEIAILSRAGFTGRLRSDATFIDLGSLPL